jgi:hypothetical protein
MGIEYAIGTMLGCLLVGLVVIGLVKFCDWRRTKSWCADPTKRDINKIREKYKQEQPTSAIRMDDCSEKIRELMDDIKANPDEWKSTSVGVYVLFERKSDSIKLETHHRYAGETLGFVITAGLLKITEPGKVFASLIYIDSDAYQAKKDGDELYKISKWFDARKDMERETKAEELYKSLDTGKKKE